MHSQQDNTQSDKLLQNVGPILYEMHTYLSPAFFNRN